MAKTSLRDVIGYSCFFIALIVVAVLAWNDDKRAQRVLLGGGVLIAVAIVVGVLRWAVSTLKK